MATPVTKLLIVDDSALMRRQLSQLFENNPNYRVYIARNGREAVEENQRIEPDVITLDINMPEMDGLTALSLIMASRPVPVVMISSLTAQGAMATFEALALGAVDYITKPDGTISLTIDKVKDEILAKVQAAAKAQVKVNRITEPEPELPPSFRPRFERIEKQTQPSSEDELEGLVIIGVSTGGPGTLERILPLLPADYPYPVVVAQHMPAAFTGPFAQRLNGLCALEVVEAAHPLEVKRGRIYIARGSADVVINVRAGKLIVQPRPELSKMTWHPSVELLARSVLKHCEAKHIIAVMLTGMGYDGADGFAEIYRQGGRTIAESQDSAIVYGMPKELIERRGAQKILSADQIAAQLIDWAQT